MTEYDVEIVIRVRADCDQNARYQVIRVVTEAFGDDAEIIDVITFEAKPRPFPVVTSKMSQQVRDLNFPDEEIGYYGER